MEKSIGYKIIYSLNMLAYLRMQNVEFSLDFADSLVFGLVEDSPENNLVIDNYKADVEIQTFLHSFQALRNEIKELRYRV